MSKTATSPVKSPAPAAAKPSLGATKVAVRGPGRPRQAAGRCRRRGPRGGRAPGPACPSGSSPRSPAQVPSTSRVSPCPAGRRSPSRRPTAARRAGRPTWARAAALPARLVDPRPVQDVAALGGRVAPEAVDIGEPDDADGGLQASRWRATTPPSPPLLPGPQTIRTTGRSRPRRAPGATGLRPAWCSRSGPGGQAQALRRRVSMPRTSSRRNGVNLHGDPRRTPVSPRVPPACSGVAVSGPRLRQ